MLFDALCRAVESGQDDSKTFDKMRERWRGILRRAKIFNFDLTRDEIQAEGVRLLENPSWRQFMEETFFLPFPVVVIEDRRNCLLIEDVGDEQGWLKTRNFINITKFDEEDMARNPDLNSHLSKLGSGIVVYTIECGTSNFAVGGDDADSWLFFEHGEFHNKMHLMRGDKYKGLSGPDSIHANNIQFGFNALAFLNTPDRFVVEIEGGRKKHDKPRPKLLRAHERPKYTLLKKPEIKRIFSESYSDESDTADRRSPIAHFRRKHLRCLRSERFLEGKRGSYVAVEACWVGPKEKMVDGKVYRVLVDL